MAEINDLIKDFTGTKLETKKISNESILSFEGRGLKLLTEEDAVDVANEIESAEKVDGIVFKGNTVGTGAAKKIGEALTRRTEFKRALWSDMFTGRLKAEIPPALLSLCGGIETAGARLVELDLSDNAFGPNGASGIVHFLRSPSAYSLEILKLNNTGLGIQGGKMIAAALKDCHASSTAAGTPLKLRVFVAGRSRLENDAGRALAECFKIIGTLEEVTMPQNGIYHVGIAALADAFAHNPSMRVINLSDNTLTVKGAKEIANVLSTMPNLEAINFDDCLLKSQGGLILADSMKNSCKNLRELRLNGNEFDTSTGLALVASMGNKRDLKVLEMNANAFGEDGIESITAKAAALNLRDALGAFDEDEEVSEAGSDDEEAEGNESDDEGAAEEEDDEDEGNTTTEAQSEREVSLQLSNTNGANNVSIEELSVSLNGSCASKTEANTLDAKLEHLFLNPQAATLIELEEMLPGHMDPLIVDRLRNPDDVVGFALGVSSLVDGSSDDVKNMAQKYAEMLLRGAFESQDSKAISNAILEHLGVIKSEYKLKKLPNMAGALKMLSIAVTKDWFPPECRSLLGFVINQRKTKLEIDDAALTDLMNGLSVK